MKNIVIKTIMGIISISAALLSPNEVLDIKEIIVEESGEAIQVRTNR